MAETVLFFDGNSYPANTVDNVFEAICQAGLAGKTGVLVGNGNNLAVTGTSSPVAVASGMALVKGKLYENTASKNLTVATPATSTRIDRVVLRLSYAAGTCTAVVLAGTEGTGLPPTLTQVDGTTWEISLAKVSITTGGVITVTSERRRARASVYSKGDVMTKLCVLSGHYPIDRDLDAPDYDWHLANGDTENGVQTRDLRDRVLMGAGTAYPAYTTGGAATANLAHTHSGAGLSAAVGTHQHQVTMESDWGGGYSSGGTNPIAQLIANDELYASGAGAVSGSTASAGSSSQSILPPYAAEYVFVYVGPNDVAI